MLLTTPGNCSGGNCETYDATAFCCQMNLVPAGYDYLSRRPNAGETDADHCHLSSYYCTVAGDSRAARCQTGIDRIYACPPLLSWNATTHKCDNAYLHAGDIGTEGGTPNHWVNMVPFGFVSNSTCEDACGGCHGVFVSGGVFVDCANFNGCKCSCNDLGTTACHDVYFPYEWDDGCCYTQMFTEDCPPTWTMVGGQCKAPCNVPTCLLGYTWNSTTHLCERTVADPVVDAGEDLHFNLHNHLYRARIVAEHIEVGCATDGQPSWPSYNQATTPDVSLHQTDVQPRIVTEHTYLTAYLIYTRYTSSINPNMRGCMSTDNGLTWRTDISMLPGCSHGDQIILPANNRRVVMGVEDATHKLAVVRAEEGSLTFSAVVYAQEKSGLSLVTLLLAIDTFRLAAADDMPGTILMAAKRNGGTSYTIFESTDDCLTWKAVA